LDTEGGKRWRVVVIIIVVVVLMAVVVVVVVVTMRSQFLPRGESR